MTARRFCFTLNNPTDGELHILSEAGGELEHVKFVCWQLEAGAQGTVHVQGYVELDKPVRIGGVKAALKTDRAHIERANGTREQNVAYCSKDEGRVADGPRHQRGADLAQGKRSDLADVADKIKAGTSLAAIAAEHSGTFVRNYRGLQVLQSLVRAQPPSQFRELTVIVHVGAAGLGKTYKAVQYATEEHGESVFLHTNIGKNWCDGYGGEDAVVIDDLQGEDNFDFGLFLRMLDVYTCKVPIKGGSVNWTPKDIYITSNLAPVEWFPHIKPHQLGALERRLTIIRHFTHRVDDGPGGYHQCNASLMCPAVPQ